MAYTKGEFTKTPWTTNQSYTRPSFFSDPNDQRRRILSMVSLKQEEELYLYNINTEEQVVLRLIPNSVSESYSPKIVSVSPFGTISPINYYVGGSSKTISFSIEVFEDFINSENTAILNKLPSKSGSIYKFIENIKRMSEPVDYLKTYLLEPLIYFQLGNQFVGKGHIQTSISYQKPYRNGRYTNAKIDMQITFHEEFEDDPINLGDETYIGQVSNLAIDSSLLDDFSSYEDFITMVNDPDYFITQIFENQKMQKFFNSIKQSETEKILGTENTQFSQQRRDEFFDKIKAGEDLENNGYYNNPYGLEIINAHFSLSLILSQDLSPNSKTENLIKLKNKLQESFEAYRNSYVVGREGYGWYTVQTDSDLGEMLEYIQMTDREKSDYRRAYSYIVNTITSLIDVYTNLYSAGG